MATPPTRNTANTDTAIDLAALQLAANNYFIDQATLAITQAIATGKYVAYLTSFENCDITSLVNYFIGLGYNVSFPDMFKITGTQGQAAELFGPSWNNFWVNGGLPATFTNPTRIAISWQ